MYRLNCRDQYYINMFSEIRIAEKNNSMKIDRQTHLQACMRTSRNERTNEQKTTIKRSFRVESFESASIFFPFVPFDSTFYLFNKLHCRKSLFLHKKSTIVK